MALRINNNPNLSSMSGAFPHLTKVATGRLEIKNNAALVGFAGSFSLLEETADDVQIESSNIATLAGAFPALTLIKGTLHIESMSMLTTLAGAFPELVTCDNSGVEIYNNAALTTMQGFLPALVNADWFELYDNVSLTNLTNALGLWNDSGYIEFYSNGAVNITGSFASKQFTEYIEIYGDTGSNAGVASLAGAFPATTTVGYIELFNLDGLTSLAGAFPALTLIEQTVSQLNGYVKLRNLPNLTTAAAAFPQVAQIQILEIQNVGLATLGAFPALTSVKGVHIGDIDTPENPGVFNVPAYQGSLRLVNNPNLTNLASLAAVTSVGQELLINNNAALADVSVLQNIAGSSFTASSGYSSVTITNNPQLPTVSQAQALINNLIGEGYVGARTNTGNLAETTCSAFELADVTNMFAGAVTLNSNADIAALAGFDGISGDLIVNGGVTSLVGLEGLRYIGVQLFLTNATGLTTLTGLDNLTTINGGLYLQNNPSITTLAALGKLHRVNHLLSLAGMTALTTLDGAFPCLETIGPPP